MQTPDETDSALVIGSGPTGVACAQALLERGSRVRLIDIGRSLDGARRAAVDRMQCVAPEYWDASDQSAVSLAGTHGQRRKMPLKLAFGSDFAYAEHRHGAVSQKGTACIASWAKGGLSNVWGAAMLPYRDESLSGWPISAADLADHYTAIARTVGLLSPPDDPLESLWPRFGSPEGISLSYQARTLLGTLARNSDALAAMGLRYGPARLAIDPSTCKLCQRCLTGCVYGSIYCTARTVDDLQRHPRFSYRAGLRALSWHETQSDVQVRCIDEASGRPTTVGASLLFVGAGVLETARIVALSAGTAKRALQLAFHPYFLLPGWISKPPHDVEAERLHTLCQIYIEIMDARVSAHGLHLQAYTYSPMLKNRIAGIPFLGPLARRAVLPRMAVVQGFLDSREADPIRMQVQTDAARGTTAIELEADEQPAARRVITKAVELLKRASTLTGLRPISPALTVGIPGEGNHIGGTFPMSKSPGPGETDTIGRPHGSTRVHLIDASVFPYLPASTITFTAMANARRIALAAVSKE